VTAFELFTRQNVQVGVVETGMGGLEDSTNILRDKAVTVISHIGLDHQKFLGNTLTEVAKHKAGILRKDVPLIYDATNAPEVVNVIKATAAEVGASPILPKHVLPTAVGSLFVSFGRTLYNRKHLRTNISCAFAAVREVLPQLGYEWAQSTKGRLGTQRQLEDAIMGTVNPGRVQEVDLVNLVGAGEKRFALLDGAHNVSAAEQLELTVRNDVRTVRKGHKRGYLPELPVTWVLALSKGKGIAEITKPLIWKGDSAVTVEFGPVDGMPWVEATPADEIADVVRGLGAEEVKAYGKDVFGALKWAVEQAGANPIVVTGSLYLISDVLRMLREADTKPGAKGTDNYYAMALADFEPKGVHAAISAPKGRPVRPVGRPRMAQQTKTWGPEGDEPKAGLPNRRGRPPKDDELKESSPKRRGRPPKNDWPKESPPKRRVGRPKKTESEGNS
jgi:dihydrofolate synthase